MKQFVDALKQGKIITYSATGEMYRLNSEGKLEWYYDNPGSDHWALMSEFADIISCLEAHHAEEDLQILSMGTRYVGTSVYSTKGPYGGSVIQVKDNLNETFTYVHLDEDGDAKATVDEESNYVRDIRDANNAAELFWLVNKGR